jgi:hypothetical protein
MMAPAPAPAPEAAVMPAAPMMAPKAADDMTGSVGFGVGVVGGTDLVKPDGSVMMKYWLSDAMAIVPKLDLSINKTKNVDTSWGLAPAVLADFTLLKGASTRFSAGAGLGLAFAKNQPPAAATPAATFIDIFVPAQLGVEHFFARWFSMGIGAQFHALDFQKQGDGWKFGFDLSNVNYMGSLFIYTD